MKLSTIAFDADDTLWENEQFFRLTQDRFVSLLADYAEADHLAERLEAAERRNLGHYGFGIKGFVLSMIEAAIDVTENRVHATVIKELIDAGQDMLRHPINLLPHARQTVERLAGGYQLMVITKGDLLDQERKVAQSGLGDLFDGIEIVSDKTPGTYKTIFGRMQGGAAGAVMVGNSMKSDVIPAIGAGAFGVHVPQNLAWSFEHAEDPVNVDRFHRIPTLAELEGLIAEIES